MRLTQLGPREGRTTAVRLLFLSACLAFGFAYFPGSGHAQPAKETCYLIQDGSHSCYCDVGEYSECTFDSDCVRQHDDVCDKTP